VAWTRRCRRFRDAVASAAEELAQNGRIPCIYTVSGFPGACCTNAPRLRRTALPVELLVPARGIAPRGARRAGQSAGILRARRHGRMLAFGHRPRAPRGEGDGSRAHRRQRGHARRRREARAARHRSRELRQPVAVADARPAQRDEGQLRARP
jgi:hypothetical protein